MAVAVQGNNKKSIGIDPRTMINTNKMNKKGFWIRNSIASDNIPPDLRRGSSTLPHEGQPYMAALYTISVRQFVQSLDVFTLWDNYTLITPKSSFSNRPTNP